MACVVAGVVADVPVVADFAAVVLVVDLTTEVLVDFVDRVATLVAAEVVCFAVEAAVAVVACAASPANSPVPVSAPASDHRVRRLIRSSPASRSRRLRWLVVVRFM